MIDRPSAMVDADDIRRVVATYADCGHDFVLRAGCAADTAPTLLLAAVGQLLDALTEDPASVGNLLGCWLRDAETLAARAAAHSGDEPAEVPDDGDDVDGDDVDRHVRAVLAGGSQGDARLLLLRDTYDLAPGAVAVAVGVDLSALRRRIGTARLDFLRGYDPAAAGLLDDLPTCPTDLGQLAALCDSTAPPPLGAELRRHAYRCQRCEETAELLRRARRILSRLTVRRLDPAARSALVADAGELADSRLSVLDAMLDAGAPVTAGGNVRRPAVRRIVVGAALTVALVTGLITGAAIGLADQKPPTATSR